MLLALFLQSSWPTLHPLVTTLLGAVLTGLATWFWTSRSERRAARTKAEQAAADKVAADSTWRQSRLDAEQALREALKQEASNRQQWQLENDSDLARIADILKDVNETQKLTAKLAADSQHHGGELLRINSRVEDVSKLLNQFMLDHARHS